MAHEGTITLLIASFKYTYSNKLSRLDKKHKQVTKIQLHRHFYVDVILLFKQNTENTSKFKVFL